jgi:hypothetical protein
MRLVIVSGALANKPFNGGNAWSRLSWVLGFKKLGFDVFFVEQISHDACLDSNGQICPFEQSINLDFFEKTMAQFGLSDACSLIYRDGQHVHGAPVERLAAMADKGSLLFNMSGHLTIPEIRKKATCKVYYDDDPGFTQFWQVDHNPGTRLWDHDFYFTIGENIGNADCPIPTGDLRWHHTRVPVVLEDWPVVRQEAFDRFTTVASWRGPYGPVHHQGKTYGLKVHEFRKFIDLPQRSGRQFEIALQIHPADHKDLKSLLAYGWSIRDPVRAAGSPNAFQDYVQTSGAEFSVAQGIYVETNSGWFSDRTVRYLASGKPALVQDTGFSRRYPVGQGLVSFRDIDQAIEGANRIARDYQQHCKAARQIAEEFFNSKKVIQAMTDKIGLKIA